MYTGRVYLSFIGDVADSRSGKDLTGWTLPIVNSNHSRRDFGNKRTDPGIVGVPPFLTIRNTPFRHSDIEKIPMGGSPLIASCCSTHPRRPRDPICRMKWNTTLRIWSS